MTIQAGDRIPSITLKRLTADGMSDVDTGELFAGKKTVMFGVPGAFTPTCSNKHLPGFVEQADTIKAKGVDQIICMAVNDPFVMKAWGDQAGAADSVMLLPDGNGDLTAALGLELDASGHGLGHRCKRFAMVIDDGTVQMVTIDDSGLSTCSADSILASL